MKKVLALIAAVLVAALPASGCSVGNSKANELTLYNWSEYMPQSVLDDFKAKTGIVVRQQTYSTNEEMLAKFQSGSLGQYDIAVPSNYYIPTMIASHYIQPFDKGSVPNLSNINPTLLNRDFDKGNQYSAPYFISMAMLVVNRAKVNTPITSFNDLLKPEFSKKIVTVDDEREIIGIALEANGFGGSETDSKKLEQVKQWLKKFNANVLVYDNDSPKSKLISGDATVGYIWNGEATLAMKQNKDLALVWPKEGGMLSIDNMVLLSKTQHKKAAEQFINYVLDPKVGAKIVKAYPYTTPNKAALEYLDDSYKNSESSNISDEHLNAASLEQIISGSAQTLYDRMWSEVKQ